MDILDIMIKWMDMDGSHNFANEYVWIWISIFGMGMDGYGFT